MQGPFLRKYGIQTTINFHLFEIDGVDFRVDAADGGTDCSIMKDEGDEATCTNDFTDEGTGYSLVLTATEMQAARIVVYVVDIATKVWLDTAIMIETYGHASAMHAVDLADSVRAGLTALPNAAADAIGGLPISDAGGLDLDAKLANTNEVTVARMGALTDWINGGRLDLILDIIAADVVNIDGDAMRGTNSAALASVCTEARLAELAAANLPADVDTLLSRITAAVALASVCTEARLAELDAANIPTDLTTIIAYVDELETRLSSARAGYLDNLSAGAVAMASICTEARLAELVAANIPADIDTLIARLTSARAGYLDELASANIPADVDAIKAKTDNQPAGIPKNVALNNFEFLMILSADHITPATGKTLTEEISKDGGAFADCTNTAVEVGSGVYRINLTQTEMNADIITLKFTETDCDQRTITIKTSA